MFMVHHRVMLFFLLGCISPVLLKSQTNDSVPSKKWVLKNPLEYQKGRFQMSVYPVSSYDPMSGWEFGVMPVFAFAPKKDSLSNSYYRSSSITSHFTYSTKNWTNIRIEGQLFTHGFNIVAYCQFLNDPSSFYGIGNDTINKNPSLLMSRYFKIGGELTKGFSSIHFVGIKFEFLNQDITDIQGTVLNPSIEGYSGGNSFGLGPVYKCDTRNNVNFPTKGFLLQTSAVYFFMLDNSSKKFAIYSFDYRRYCSIFKSYVIACQGTVSASTGDVPFYKLPCIGGKYNLRGISNKFMYIDKNVWFVQSEIRKTVYKRIGVVAFGGVGNVFATWNNDMVSHLKTVYGFGGRYQILPNDKINLRFDYAFGPNSDHGVYATIREAF